MALTPSDGIANYAFSTVDPQESILTGAGISDGVLPQTGSIVRYYHYSAGSGSTLSDASTQAADGTVNGPAWVSGYAGYGGLNFTNGDGVQAVGVGPKSAFTITFVLDYADMNSDQEYAVWDQDEARINVGKASNSVPGARIFDGSANTVHFSSGSADTYYMVTARWDGSTFDLWNGGTQEDSISQSGLGSYTSGDTDLGNSDGQSGTSGGAYAGTQSLFLYWNSALTNTEIQDVASKLGF